jgi:hypothetical protein
MEPPDESVPMTKKIPTMCELVINHQFEIAKSLGTGCAAG